jgi:hypothetical protein
MFDVAFPQYHEDAYFDAEEREAPCVSSRAAVFGDRVLIDPRLFLSLAALGVAATTAGPGAFAALVASGVFLLSIALRPRLDERHSAYGAFRPVELGFLLWMADPRSALMPGARRRATAAAGVVMLSTLGLVIAAATGAAVHVMAAAAVALVALGAMRLALGQIVSRGI